MILKWASLLCAMFAFVPCTPAQRGAPEPAATTQQPSMSHTAWETPEVRAALDRSLYPVEIKIGTVKNGSVQVEADLQNFTAKTITTYGVSITARYADGSEQVAGKAIDSVLSDTVLSRMPRTTLPNSGGTLNPHEIHRHTEPFPLDAGGLPPIYATAKVTMIIFEDGTSLGDPLSAQQAFADCKKGRPEGEVVLAEVRKVMAKREVQSAAPSEQDRVLEKALADRITEISGASGWTADQIKVLQLFHRMLTTSRQHFDLMLSRMEELQRANIGPCTLGGAQ